MLSSKLKKGLTGAIASLGYDLVPRWQRDSLELTSHLQELFRLLDIRCVLDVGANAGQYRDFLRQQVGYEGLILSFEPVAELVAMLQRRAAADDKWKVYPFALGSADTTSTINVAVRSQFSSFLTPDTSIVQEYQGKNAVAHQETVTVRRLDSVLPELRQEQPIENVYLKMDTQGYDLEVIEGAGSMLGEIMALQSEVSVLKIYSGMPDYFTSIRTLNDKGFDITGLFQVNRDRWLRVVEFDCVMIRRSLAASSAV